VRLYHATSERKARDILVRGFAVSHVRDSPDGSWFSSDPCSCISDVPDAELFVVVDIPDEIAELHRYILPDGSLYLDNYFVPWTVVNRYRATFESFPIPASEP